jgi:hypothetical protein
MSLHITVTLTEEQAATILEALHIAAEQTDDAQLAASRLEVMRVLEGRIARAGERRRERGVQTEQAEPPVAEPHAVFERQRERKTVMEIEPASMVGNIFRSAVNWLENRER